jgi:hypothetical protein
MSQIDSPPEVTRTGKLYWDDGFPPAMLRDTWVEGEMEWIIVIVFAIIVVYLVRSAASRSRPSVLTVRAARSTAPMAEVQSSVSEVASVAAGSPPTERAVGGTGATPPMAEAPTSEEMLARSIAKFRTEMEAAKTRMHEEVLADAEYNVWRLFQLNGLVVGSWVATVVEIGERLNLAHEKRWQNFQAEQIKKQAANLPS